MEHLEHHKKSVVDGTMFPKKTWQFVLDHIFGQPMDWQARSEAANEELRALRLFVQEETQRQVQARAKHGNGKSLILFDDFPIKTSIYR